MLSTGISTNSSPESWARQRDPGLQLRGTATSAATSETADELEDRSIAIWEQGATSLTLRPSEDAACLIAAAVNAAVAIAGTLSELIQGLFKNVCNVALRHHRDLVVRHYDDPTDRCPSVPSPATKASRSSSAASV